MAKQLVSKVAINGKKAEKGSCRDDGSIFQFIRAPKEYYDVLAKDTLAFMMYTSRACYACNLFERELSEKSVVFLQAFPGIKCYKVNYLDMHSLSLFRCMVLVPNFNLITGGEDYYIRKGYIPVDQMVSEIKALLAKISRGSAKPLPRWDGKEPKRVGEGSGQ